jgi:replicative DNA helicase
MQKNNTKQPPNNLEAERAVIGSILIDDKAIDKVIPILTPQDFYHPSHKLIFEHLINMHEQNKPLDFVTLVSSLNNNQNMGKAGGIEYITSLANTLPNSANITYYAEEVKDKSLLRHLITTTSEISELSFNYSGDVGELIDSAEKKIFDLAENKVKKDILSLGDIVYDTFKKIEEFYENKDKNEITGITTGFIDLDKITNGMQPSDLIIIAGRPAMGKTAFCLNIALNAAKYAGKSTAIFSLEMSSQQLAMRLLSSEAKVEATKLRNGRLNQEDWSNLASASGDLSQYDIYIDDTPAISVMELRAKCRRIKREQGLDMVMVDYLQLMSGGRSDSREQQISEISRSLKALAKELDIPVIALSQLNRGVEGRTDKRPIPSDLRESGAIEQDADIIIFLYRDEFYNKDTKEPGVAEIIIAKHRHGPTGTIKLAFVKENTRFENIADERFISN